MGKGKLGSLNPAVYRASGQLELGNQAMGCPEVSRVAIAGSGFAQADENLVEQIAALLVVRWFGGRLGDGWQDGMSLVCQQQGENSVEIQS